MASQNDIANHCLDLLGENSIADISDSVERAERILAAWDNTRDRSLRAHRWSFAIERASLPADSATPVWGFDHQYALDADVVALVQVDEYYAPAILADHVNADTAYFRLEQRKILTDLDAPLKVRWIVNSIDVGSWDACFAAVMACNLADRLSTRVTGSETIKARIKAERRDALRDALRANAIEIPPVQPNDGSWIASRFSV
jgi:hypothetical protein